MNQTVVLLEETLNRIQKLGIQINFERHRVSYWNSLTKEQKKELFKHCKAQYDPKDDSLPNLKTEQMFSLVNKESGGIEVAIAKVARTLKFITTSDLEEILEDLGYYAMPKVPPIKQTPKPDLPFWNAAEGKLYFKGKEVRSLQLREKPSNTQQVLEAFQREKWPTEIPHPFGKSPSKAKHAVKYLNEIRTGIEFYARHKGRTLSWKPV